MVWLKCDCHMITWDECDPNFLRLRENPEKILNKETDPTGDRTRARSNHSRGREDCGLIWHKNLHYNKGFILWSITW